MFFAALFAVLFAVLFATVFLLDAVAFVLAGAFLVDRDSAMFPTLTVPAHSVDYSGE